MFEKYVKENNEEIIGISDLTVNEFKKLLDDLSKEGYGNRIVSCCGCTDFYIHLFNKESKYITFDTEEEI